mgnify:CR=1 FL=1
MTKISKGIYDEIVIEKFLEMKMNKKIDEFVLERIILAHLSFFSVNDFYEYEKLNIYEKSIYFRIITQGMISLYLNNKYLDMRNYRKKFQIQYKRAQYYNILSYAWDILSKDVKERTMLIADECHILVDPNISQTLEYVRYISKMARKHNSSIVVITQSIEDFLSEKIRLYGQSLLTNSTYKMFFKTDGKDLKDIVTTFKLTEQEEKMLLNANVGECLFMAGIRKIYIMFKLFQYEFLSFFGNKIFS